MMGTKRYFIHEEDDKIIVTSSPDKVSDKSELLGGPFYDEESVIRRAFKLAGNNLTVQFPGDFVIPPMYYEIGDTKDTNLLAMIEKAFIDDVSKPLDIVVDENGNGNIVARDHFNNIHKEGGSIRSSKRFGDLFVEKGENL